MSKPMRFRISPSMVVALAALVVAASGGAYAAVQSSGKSIAACVDHKGGALYVAGKCHRGDRRLKWSVTGPRGATGATGAQGPQGAQGATGPTGTPDPSQFYDKATSDGRFVHGSGTVTTIPLVDVPNGLASSTIVDVAGAGKLEVTSCAIANQGLKYTNESANTQNWVLAGAYHWINNVLPDSGTVAAGATFVTTNNGSHDVMRLDLSNGTKVLDFLVNVSRTAGNDCLYWGEVYSG